MGLMTFTKRSAAVIRCDPSLLYEVLTDYDTYFEWMPLIAKSKLLAKEGDLAIAEFELVRPPKDKFVVECIHTKNKMVLWRRIGGKLPVAQVELTIEPVEQNQSRVTITMQGRTSWARVIPAYKRFMNIGRFLKALQAQISVFLPELALTDKEGETILEISETNDGLMCWIRGKKYILTPAPEGTHD